MTPPEPVTDAQPGAQVDAQLEAGAIVAVMSPFTGEWRNGFVVLTGGDLAYVLGREDSPGVRTAAIPKRRVRRAHPAS